MRKTTSYAKNHGLIKSLGFYTSGDEIEEHGSILCSEVREQDGILIGEDFGSYKKFERLAERIKKFLDWKQLVMQAKQRSELRSHNPTPKQVVITTQTQYLMVDRKTKSEQSTILGIIFMYIS